MTQLTCTILGCGSSGGVPRIGNHWGACDPKNPKNRRRRCSILFEQIGSNGTTRVLIDTSPDMREQLLDANIGELDAVLFTHDHADHMHGLDDLRMIGLNMGKRVPVYSDAATKASLFARFGYALVQPENSSYPPILEHHDLFDEVTIDGAGGPLTLRTISVIHGNMNALGFRVNDFAYIPDVSKIPDETWHQLGGLETWVIDCLRYKPHPSHSHLENTLDWIGRAAPQNAILTNLHNDLDYEVLKAETPNNVMPAFDGMTINIT